MRFLEWIANIGKGFKEVESIIPWLGILFVSILGGATAFIKEWEDKDPDRTMKQHMWALTRKLLFALVAGIMWYQIVVWQEMTGSPLSYLGATLVGLYATEFLDFLWAQFKSRVGGMKEPK